MEHLNQTFPENFILLGLSNVSPIQFISFFIFLLIYMITVSGNFLLLVVVIMTPMLHTPMYFFLSNLSVIDISFSCTIVPKILVNTLSTDKSISFSECAIQMYIHLVLGATESMLLAIMAYDRYVAICRPLHYRTIMNFNVCTCLVAVSWSVGFINALVLVLPTLKLPFCGSNHINHFFCEIPPLLHISCTNTHLNEALLYASAGTIVMCLFFFILISYVHIMTTILKIHSLTEGYKVFSTCASHITVVTLYYGTIMFIYLRPYSTYYQDTDKIVSLLYTAVTPMLNPFIYSMRNKDFKGSMSKSLYKTFVSRSLKL